MLAGLGGPGAWGAAGAASIRHRLTTLGDSEGVARYLLDRLTGEQVAAITIALLKDASTDALLKIQLPRTPLDIAENTNDPGEMNIAQIRQYLTLLQATGNQKEIRRFRLRIDQKMAFPFACLIFGLVGSTPPFCLFPHLSRITSDSSFTTTTNSLSLSLSLSLCANFAHHAKYMHDKSTTSLRERSLPKVRFR